MNPKGALGSEEMDLGKVRRFHQENVLNGCCGCEQDWSCDAIQLADEVERHRSKEWEWEATISTLREDVERLQEALGFYGREGTYQNDQIEAAGAPVSVPYTAPIFLDCGQIARAAFEEPSDGGEPSE